MGRKKKGKRVKSLTRTQQDAREDLSGGAAASSDDETSISVAQDVPVPAHNQVDLSGLSATMSLLSSAQNASASFSKILKDVFGQEAPAEAHQEDGSIPLSALELEQGSSPGVNASSSVGDDQRLPLPFLDLLESEDARIMRSAIESSLNATDSELDQAMLAAGRFLNKFGTEASLGFNLLKAVNDLVVPAAETHPGVVGGAEQQDGNGQAADREKDALTNNEETASIASNMVNLPLDARMGGSAAPALLDQDVGDAASATQAGNQIHQDEEVDLRGATVTFEHLSTNWQTILRKFEALRLEAVSEGWESKNDKDNQSRVSVVKGLGSIFTGLEAASSSLADYTQDKYRPPFDDMRLVSLRDTLAAIPLKQTARIRTLSESNPNLFETVVKDPKSGFSIDFSAPCALGSMWVNGLAGTRKSHSFELYLYEMAVAAHAQAHPELEATADRPRSFSQG